MDESILIVNYTVPYSLAFGFKTNMVLVNGKSGMSQENMIEIMFILCLNLITINKVILQCTLLFINHENTKIYKL